MIVTVATLCDFAQVREGLLSIVAGGISEVQAQSFPAPVATTLAVSLLVAEQDFESSFTVTAGIRQAGGADEYGARISADIDLRPDGSLVLGHDGYINLVIPVSRLSVAEPGEVIIDVLIDDVVQVGLPLRISAMEGADDAEQPDSAGA